MISMTDMEKDDEMVVTLVDEDGNEKEFVVADFVEVEDKKYAVLVAAECDCECECEGEDDECCEEDAYIFRVEVDENGEEVLADIEDDEEYERVIDALDELEDYEEVEDLDDEE